MTVRPVAWIGIDAGKAAHHAAAVDENGPLCWSRRVPSDQAAIGELIARAAATAAEVRWAVDLTGSAAALLLAVGTPGAASRTASAKLRQWAR